MIFLKHKAFIPVVWLLVKAADLQQSKPSGFNGGVSCSYCDVRQRSDRLTDNIEVDSRLSGRSCVDELVN